MMYLYALVDPRVPSEVRYIGVTASNPLFRLCQHVADSRPARINSARKRDREREEAEKRTWVRSLVTSGLLPAVRCLAALERKVAFAVETAAIKSYRQAGHRLTNVPNAMENPDIRARCAAAGRSSGGYGASWMSDPEKYARVREGAKRAGKLYGTRGGHVTATRDRKDPNRQAARREVGKKTGASWMSDPEKYARVRVGAKKRAAAQKQVHLRSRIAKLEAELASTLNSLEKET